MSGFTFGAPAAPAGGSLFGAAPAASGGGSLFGAKPVAPVTGGLFGASTSQPAGAAGGLFGQPAISTAGSGLFGQPATPTAGAGLFGGMAASTAPGSGGLFGAPAAPAAGGFFGAPASSAAPFTGGLFGGATSTVPAAGGLLGGAPASGSLFGPPAPGTGMFGSKPATATGTPFSFAGASTTAAPGMFASAPGMFASAPKPFASTGPGFGLGATSTTAASTAPNFAASLASGQRQQYVMSNVKPQIPVWQKLMYIKNSWDPTHPNCHFRYFFYNFVHPDDVNKYGQPPNVDAFEWHTALEKCPDRECMVPTLAVGFEDLKKRMESQNEMTEMQRIKLDEIEAKMNVIMEFHLIQTAAKVREFKRRHIQLAQRVLTLMKRVQILRNRGVPIRADEEMLRVRLENALEQLRNPAHFRGKITELWAQIQILKDSKRLHPSGNYGATDEAQLEAIGKFLQDQQAGLKHVTDVLQRDMQDIEILQRKLEDIGSSARV